MLFEITHKELVESAYKWILKNGSCGVAFKELHSLATNGEQPDVIGFGAWGHSVVIECKKSKTDFIADSKKRFRKSPEEGMGSVRYYCCPSGLLMKEDLPIGWGLLYVDNNLKCKVHHKPLIEKEGGVIQIFRHERNLMAEHGLMYSVLRRLHLRGRIPEIYEPKPDAESIADSLKLEF